MFFIILLFLCFCSVCVLWERPPLRLLRASAFKISFGRAASSPGGCGCAVSPVARRRTSERYRGFSLALSHGVHTHLHPLDAAQRRPRVAPVHAAVGRRRSVAVGDRVVELLMMVEVVMRSMRAGWRSVVGGHGRHVVSRPAEVMSATAERRRRHGGRRRRPMLSRHAAVLGAPPRRRQLCLGVYYVAAVWRQTRRSGTGVAGRGGVLAVSLQGRR